MIYLCGPINACSDSEATDWREYAKAHLSCETLDPMRRDYRGRGAECVNEIVELDKLDVLTCSALLVFHPKPSVGTSMEVLFAWGLHKPIVVVDVSGKPISPWMVYHATVIMSSVDEAIEWLNARFGG